MRRQVDPIGPVAPLPIVVAPRLAPTEATRRWASLLQQIFEADPLACPRCHGTMRILAFITQTAVAVGLGSGSLTLSGNGPTTSGSNSPTLMLRFGGAIQPSVVLSGELTGWSKQKLFASWAAAVVQWYPLPAQGFYVKGGAGVATFDATECCVGSNTMTTDGGLDAGTGFDHRISRGFFLTPYGDFLFQNPNHRPAVEASNPHARGTSP
jgi:hypothetical protein